MTKLTESFLKRLPHSDIEKRWRVAANVYARQRGSVITFIHRRMVAGRFATLTLGRWPAFTLDDAIRASLDRKTQGHGLLVREGIERYTRQHIATLRPPSIRVAKWYLAKLEVAYGKRRLDSLRRDELLAVITSEFVRRKKLPSANRCLSCWSAFLSYCTESGWLRVNVLANTSRRVAGGAETSRDRILTEQEIRALWTDAPANHKRFFRLLLLTACRVGELRQAKWSWIRGTTLYLPPEATKGKRAHMVPLSDAALKVLGPAGKPNAFVFQFRSNSVVHAALQRSGAKFRPHDCRRTCATLLAKLGVQPYVIEKCLAHAMPKLMATYMRHDYELEVREAFYKLSEAIGSIVADSDTDGTWAV